MKIQQLSVKNITCYKEQTTFAFDNGINILIGPNGGGKSNLQKILAIVLSKFFIHQYDFKKNEKESSIELIDLWTRQALEQQLDRFLGDNSDQVIEIRLAAEESDIRNIKLISENLDRLNKERMFWERPQTSYPPSAYVDEIRASDSFTYRIVNLEPEPVTPGTAAWAFKEYLGTFFIYLRLSSRMPDIALSSPVFFFFSERSFNSRASLQANQVTDQSYYSGFRSAYQAAMGENTDLFTLGTRHFLRIFWSAIHRAGQERGLTVHDLIQENADVQVLRRYLNQLGYEWTFHTDSDYVNFEFTLGTGDQWIHARKFSSGEREIVHFLLAMFALNVKDGLVLIDEPELHLHPRWQRIFLALFGDVSRDRNNQFIVATHSPVFVSPDTINDITRIYRTPSGSRKVALKDVALPNKRHLIRMINSQNNERIFFSDKVVLVEGITDRLVLSSLLEREAERISNHQAIEVIEVGGKHNFAQYRSLLAALRIPAFIIADRDYMADIGSSGVKGLFVQDDRKSWRGLTKDKKSKDATTLVRALERAVKNAEMQVLTQFWEFLRGRHKSLREPLSDDESELLRVEMASFRERNILVLSEGEIEDYLPKGVTHLDDIVEMLETGNWILDVENERRRSELISIVDAILMDSGDETD